MTWDWSAVSAIATVVGVVGGLISLIFLILEVRHTAKATESGTVQSLMELEVVVFEMLATNSALYLKGSADPKALDEEEAFRFDKFVSAQMSLYYSAYVQHQAGLISDEMWRAYLATLHDYQKRPGFKVAWNVTEALYPKPFRDMVACT